MEVQRVQIEQQMARIKIETQRARLKIEQEMRQMEINMERAQMTVNRENGSLDIDSTALRNNTARRDIYTLQDHFASNATMKGRQGISEIVSKGNYLAQLPDNTGGRKVGQHAKQKLIESVSPATYGRSPLPQSGIEITGKKGEFSIDWTPYKLDISWGAMQRPVVTLDPKGSVNVELAQRASVDCTVVTMTIPKEIGNLVDTSA